MVVAVSRKDAVARATYSSATTTKTSARALVAGSGAMDLIPTALGAHVMGSFDPRNGAMQNKEIAKVPVEECGVRMTMVAGLARHLLLVHPLLRLLMG
jgi:hypothetical protein